MKTLIRQFLGKNHSWCVVGHGIANALKEQGHEVHLFSTDGIKQLPKNLHTNLVGYVEEGKNRIFGRLPDKEYDCQISYTAMHNFPAYLGSGSKNRFGIWCYEWSGENVLPKGFAKHYQSCDYLCAPSSWQKDRFIESKVPEDKIKVIPHGICSQQYMQNTTMVLPTKKRYKILANIAQNHLRKNIPDLLEAYGKAFTNRDDICLIIKGKDKPATAPFEVSLNGCLNTFYQNYPQHAEIKVLSSFIDDMSQLYRSIDTTFTMSLGEGFYFPGLESIAAGKLAIAPDAGGHTDFLINDSNALLIPGKKERANPKSMYWDQNPNAVWYRPDMDAAVHRLRTAYQNYEVLNKKIDSRREGVYDKYDWGKIATKFTALCK